MVKKAAKSESKTLKAIEGLREVVDRIDKSFWALNDRVEVIAKDVKRLRKGGRAF